MSKQTHALLSLVLIFTVLFSCDNQSETIDQDYLKTDSYKLFRQQSEDEFYAQINSRESLRRFLERLIPCQGIPEISLPLQINEKNLTAHLNNAETACPDLNSKNLSGFTAKILGSFNNNEITVSMVLVEEESIYEDRELLAVTHRDSKLIDFKTVGKFRQNLSQDISTQIEVSLRNGNVYILSATDRKMKYPIEQKNVVESGYIVDEQGSIEEG